MGLHSAERVALLCFKKETRNELMGLFWQQDAELA